MSEKQKIVAKMIEVYKAIDCVEKLGKNNSQNYNYVRSADVVRAVRKEFIAQSLYAEVNFSFEGPVFTIARAKEPNAPFAAVNVKCSLVVHDLESGETITASGLGTGADSSDKSVYKAMTGSLKYALRAAALLPDEADPEADESVDEPQGRNSSRPSGAEIPDFQDAKHGSTKPNTTRPTQAAKSEPKATTAPAAGSTAATAASSTTAPSTGATPAATPATQTTTTALADDGSLPNEEELKVFTKRMREITDDLSTKGNLKTSRNLPLNRKVLVFLLAITGATAPKTVTKAQWTDFIARVDHVIGLENGWVGLAKLVNKANGIEEKK